MIQVLARTRGQAHLESLAVDVADEPERTRNWGVPIAGSVVAALLNDEDALLAYEEDFQRPPYLAAPRAPILYLRPANTWSAHREPIRIPADLASLEVGAALGLVIGRTATRIGVHRALEHVAGYVVVNDLCAAHENVYRPAIRERCRDGFCAIGPWITPRAALGAPSGLVLRTHINGRLRAETTTTRLARGPAELIAAITDFMTLAAGDVLLLGPGADRPQARAGDSVRIEIPGVGSLENTLIGAPPVEAAP
jgi:5-oxopent-3-ene-1,2,5-tricarboxylate decarboxylase/2-hydroxyhepta-2,4-diene-1,7-dioate isomerase